MPQGATSRYNAAARRSAPLSSRFDRTEEGGEFTTRVLSDPAAREARGLTKAEIDGWASGSKYGPEGWWARFWAKVEDVDGHWLWRGASHGGGYGIVGFGPQGKSLRLLVGRVAFVYVYGDLEPGEDALHNCRHKNCLRHLKRGSQADNNADMLRDGTRARGDANGRSKAACERAKEIAARFDSTTGTTCAALAREYGVTLPTVYRPSIVSRSASRFGAARLAFGWRSERRNP